MTPPLVAAFKATCQGFSPDRVVVDPDLNQAFLRECARHGIVEAPSAINRALLNLRKRGGLRGLKSRRTSFQREDDYRFAAEVTVRFLERRDKVTLDDVICDPTLLVEFDLLANRLASAASALQLRWAALNLRKAHGLRPEILARVVSPTAVFYSSVDTIDVDAVPTSPGLYLFYSPEQPLYVGETDNLNNRIRKHIAHSDNAGFARWLWQNGRGALHVELQVLESSTTLRVRRALETELIRSRNPIFNVKR